MTAAEVKAPPVPPAPPAASVPTAGRLAAGARLAWLHQRSRRAPAALLALALCGGALRAVLHWHLMSGGVLAQQGPMVIETGAAALIAITTHSPFGEAERATGRWLPYLRLGAALALTGIAIGALQLGVTGVSLSGGVLMLARNVIGIAGIGLLSSLINRRSARLDPATWLPGVRRVRTERDLAQPVDLARPPPGRPWCLDLRRGSFRDRPGHRHIPGARTSLVDNG